MEYQRMKRRVSASVKNSRGGEQMLSPIIKQNDLAAVEPLRSIVAETHSELVNIEMIVNEIADIIGVRIPNEQQALETIQISNMDTTLRESRFIARKIGSAIRGIKEKL
jgi:hypothetical protein